MAAIDEKQQKETLVGLAIRELLMEYYKDASPNRMVRIRTGIGLRDIPGERNYQYQRRLHDLQRPKSLRVARHTIATMQRNPNEFVIVVDEERSPEMHKLIGYVRKFLKDYLPTIEVKYKPEVTGPRDDSALMDQIEVNLGNAAVFQESVYERMNAVFSETVYESFPEPEEIDVSHWTTASWTPSTLESVENATEDTDHPF